MVGGHWIDSGGMVQDLNSLIPANPATRSPTRPRSNDNGQIVADACATTSRAAVLLNPS